MTLGRFRELIGALLKHWQTPAAETISAHTMMLLRREGFRFAAENPELVGRFLEGGGFPKELDEP